MSELPSLARCRARARLLLSHLRGDDAARAQAAAQRLQRLRSLAGVSIGELRSERARLKHALTVIAVELGQPSWPALKAACRRAEGATRGELPADALYVERMALWLNHWFASYDEARACLDREGGYLLPYRRHFFVTTREAIRELGLDPDDADWQRIGFDWVQPRDTAAQARLVQRRLDALR